MNDSHRSTCRHMLWRHLSWRGVRGRAVKGKDHTFVLVGIVRMAVEFALERLHSSYEVVFTWRKVFCFSDGPHASRRGLRCDWRTERLV